MTKRQLIFRSIMISAGLLVIKVVAGVMTNSLAVLATATDSFMDLLVSLINFFFVRSAEKPADEHHPYGHGKIESLAGLLQGLFMGGVVLALAGATVHRFLNPVTITLPAAGIVVMAIALVLNLWHARNLRKSMVSTGSQLMASEYLHYASDILSHAGVIAAFVLTAFTHFLYWDPIMSVFIVMYIVVSIYRIVNSSVSELLDEHLPQAVLKEIDRTIRAFDPRIIDYHELRTRKVGENQFIEFHLEIRNVDSFEESHAITESLIATLKRKYPKSVITVHTDPEGGI